MLINERKRASVVDNFKDSTNKPDNASHNVAVDSNAPENANALQNMNGTVSAAQSDSNTAYTNGCMIQEDKDVAIMQAETLDNCTGQGNKIMESDNDKSKRKKAKTSFDKKVDKLLYAKPDYIDALVRAANCSNVSASPLIVAENPHCSNALSSSSLDTLTSPLLPTLFIIVFLLWLNEALIILNIRCSSSTSTGGFWYLSSFITAESTFGRGIKQLAGTLSTILGLA